MMKFGVSIPNVAQQVQDNIRQALKNMTAIDLDEVNIHIVGIQFDTQKLILKKLNKTNVYLTAVAKME